LVSSFSSHQRELLVQFLSAIAPLSVSDMQKLLDSRHFATCDVPTCACHAGTPLETHQ
jgi:hypothetical protein